MMLAGNKITKEGARVFAPWEQPLCRNIHINNFRRLRRSRLCKKRCVLNKN